MFGHVSGDPPVCGRQGALPRDVDALGLGATALADLGWWPIVFEPAPEFDPLYELLGDAVETLDVEGRRIVLARTVQARPVDDIRADLLAALVDPPHDALWQRPGDVVETTDEAGRLVLTREIVDRSVADIRADLVAAVEARLQVAFSAGFPWDFGEAATAFEDGTTGPAGVQTLQTRDMVDRTNWLILDSTCSKLAAVGTGETLVPIRTAANAIVQIPAVDCLQMLAAMAAHGAARMATSWALKNAIRQAEDIATLQAIDIEEG